MEIRIDEHADGRPINVTLLKTKSSHFISQVALTPGNGSKLALIDQKRVANVSLLVRDLK